MITTAVLDDVSALEKLVNSAYRGETSKQGWTTEANLLQGKRIDTHELSALFQNKENTILKFTKDNTIVGCVLLVNKGDKIYLGMLTVSPNLQNSGIGKQLLKAAETHALELNINKIVMTVISIREELIAWYNRHGFADTGDREPFPLNDTDAIIAEKPLEFVVLEKIV
ncbi:GNAT family N-acetyltransferase [Flavobacterium gilvum]|uniref:GNAT family N-acetyltransferase n=1 Tax=Flavobacterium gilvum TaxID=1492737 RepID=A0AAC9N7G9_9FLAO|nr:GNAT family N-acetyltransferase [Flavobacterium gilvum]AOW10453.1 GNAT family N-acetyltransferase [Flavobacterium gilvum]KFC57644.1 N-acetyltransferase GCN5 [Flavobacterium gilvum]